MSKVIGIDLGTTNSCVAVMEGQEARVIPNAEGARTTPSVVAIGASGERLVGQPAKRQAITNPRGTVYSAKRFIGRTYAEVHAEAESYPIAIQEAPDGGVRFALPDRSWAPAEISAAVLARIKESAEAYLGTSVTDAVITVPAYFNDSQRQATREAGQIAGLNVLRLINEPTAAALAYGLDRTHAQKVAVFDLGGGTFDVSILELGDGVFEVLATNGNTHLGGDDFDRRIVEWMIAEFKKTEGVDLSSDAMAMQRLREAAEKAKMELSSTLSTSIQLPFVTATSAGPRHLQLELSRARLEQLVEDLLTATLAPCRQALADASLSVSDIQEVVLVGGMTRMPRVQELVQSFFGREPHRGTHPDEVVALGAAIQGAVLSGDVKDVLLLDVTPLSLGLETRGGVFTRLIERNTTIPTKKTEVFTTAVDGQTSVEIHVLQGEREVAHHNRTLGRFHLEGLPGSPRGVPQIEVAFDIDANGILAVSALDRATGHTQKVRIEAGSGLSETEVRRMISDAEEHAVEDRRRREDAESRNHADGVAYRAERLLEDERQPPGARKVVQEALSALRQSLAGTDRSAWEERARLLESKLVAPSRESGPSDRKDGSRSTEREERGPVAADYEVVEDA